MMSEHGIVYFLVKKEQLSWGNIFGVLVSIWIHTTTYHLTNTKKVQKVSNITTIQKKEENKLKRDFDLQVRYLYFQINLKYCQKN